MRRMRPVVRWLRPWGQGLSALLLLACQDGEGTAHRETQLTRARGKVVATVDGASIGSDDVRALAEATGLSAGDALQRLEEAALVEQHASKLGYGARADVARETRRALVQALLAESVEREVRPELIPLDQVRERFEGTRVANGVAAEAFAQHEQAIREQLSTEQRKQALDKLLVKLRREISVQLDEAKVQKALADPAVWGGGT